MTKTEIDTQIASLQAQLKDLEKDQAAARDLVRKATKRQWKFTFKPADGPRHTWTANRDESMQMWYLHGEVANKDECMLAGHSEDSLRPGGMSYWFNSLSQKICFAEGGGNIYIAVNSYTNDPVRRAEEKEDSENAFYQLEMFILTHPEGGDVTDIVLSQRHFGWRDK